MNTKKLHYIIVVLIFLWSLKLFSYRSFDPVFSGRLTKIVPIAMSIFVLYKFRTIKKNSKEYISFPYVVLFFLYPLVTFIPCSIYHGQSFSQSLQALLPHWYISIYFLLIIFKFPVEKIIRCIIIFAIIRTGLTFFEQFTYPNVPFAFRMDGFNEELNKFVGVEVRSGFYRYLISDAYFLPLFSAIYSFVQFIQKRRTSFLLIFLVSCFGIYMDQTRQIMASLVLCLCLIPFIDSKKNFAKYIFIFIIIFAILASNFDVLFDELQERTIDDTTGDDNIRLLSYAYFFTNTGNLVTTLFGNGLSYPTSAYGIQDTDLHQIGLNTSDIGVVGALYLLGYVFITIFIMYYFFVVIKKWKSIDTYLRIYLISILINSPLIFPLYNGTLPCYECFLGMLFYMVDKSIDRKQNSNISH